MSTIIICDVRVNVKYLTIHRCQDNDSIDLGAFFWNRRIGCCCCCSYDNDDDDNDKFDDDDIVSVLLKLAIVVRLVGSVDIDFDVDVDGDIKRCRRSVFVLLLLFNISSSVLLLFSFFMLVACIVAPTVLVSLVFRRSPFLSLTPIRFFVVCLVCAYDESEEFFRCKDKSSLCSTLLYYRLH